MNLCHASTLAGYKVQAVGGPLGRLRDFLFDEETWTIRYIVVDTRRWGPGGEVLLARDALQLPDHRDRLLPVPLAPLTPYGDDSGLD